MSGVAIPASLGIAAFLGVALFVAILLVRAKLRADAAEALWRYFPRSCGVLPTGMKYLPPHATGFDACRLADALRAAITAIATHRWNAQVIVNALVQCRVEVRSTTAWKNARGVNVAGETLEASNTVVVGIDLAALAHELCHLLEWRLDRTLSDGDHHLWTEKGLSAAVDAYRVALEKL